MSLEGSKETTREDEVLGLVFDMKRYAVHDGPGIRTTVFLKGCPLRCLWCHSPESQESHQEIVYCENLCIGCRECVAVCPERCHTTDAAHKMERTLCRLCGRCVEECYSGALKMIGKYVTVGQIVGDLHKDELFYRNSGGGITISGGEPTFQPEFTLRLLRRCKQEGYHTALDTNGYVKWEILGKILMYVDLILYDLKHMDTEKHRELTGVRNELIIRNLERIDNGSKDFVVRVPLVPTCNDSDGNIEAMAEFLSTLKNVQCVEILPYHRYGVSKYRWLDREYGLKDLKRLEPDTLRQIAQKISAQGLNVISRSAL